MINAAYNLEINHRYNNLLTQFSSLKDPNVGHTQNKEERK